MAAFGGLLITNKGRALQAKAQTGVELHFNRIGVGDGNLGGQSIPTLPGLISPKMSLTLNKLKTQSGGKAIVGAVLSNQDVITGFYFREIGVFAQDPDEGEILYCYGNSGSGAEYIPATGGPDVVNKQLDVVTLIANASNVTASVASGLYALAEDVGDMSTVPTTSKTAAGAITELFEALEHADIPDATLTTKGKVQLSSATNSTAEDRAATPKAVKSAMDAAATAQTTANSAQTKANAALPASSYTAADILAKLKTVDGAGSGLDADLLAGRNSLQYAHAGTVSADQLNNSVFPAGLYVTNEALSLGLSWLWAHIINLKHASQDGYNAQIATPLDVTSGDMYVRYSVGTAWTTWKRIWTDNALRVNAGRLEFLDGGVWKGVGGEMYKKPFGIIGTINNSSTSEFDILNVSGKAGVVKSIVANRSGVDPYTILRIYVDGILVNKTTATNSHIIVSSESAMSLGNSNGWGGIGVGGALTTVPTSGTPRLDFPIIEGGSGSGSAKAQVFGGGIYFENSIRITLEQVVSNAVVQMYSIMYATE